MERNKKTPPGIEPGYPGVQTLVAVPFAYGVDLRRSNDKGPGRSPTFDQARRNSCFPFHFRVRSLRQTDVSLVIFDDLALFFQRVERRLNEVPLFLAGAVNLVRQRE